jgi:hypothetical protein
LPGGQRQSECADHCGDGGPQCAAVYHDKNEPVETRKTAARLRGFERTFWWIDESKQGPLRRNIDKVDPGVEMTMIAPFL